MCRLAFGLAVVLWITSGLVSSAADPLPADVLELVAQHDKDVAEIHARAEREVKAKQEILADKIEAFQKKYTMDGKLDEALAIRDYVKSIRAGARGIEKDPGTLRNFRDQVGKALLFEVTGATKGLVYGTDVYTDDSALAAAAVHSGALKFGEKGIVKVTMLPGQNVYEPSQKNGIQSIPWGPWDASFKVERVGPGTKSEVGAKKE